MGMSNDDDVTNELMEEYNASFLIGVRTGLQSVLYAKNKVEKDEGKPLTMDRLIRFIEGSVTETEKKLWRTEAGRKQLELHKYVKVGKEI